MKKIGRRILSLVLVVCMIAPSIIAVAKESKIEKFTDFPDDWSTQAVTAAVNNGLLHGYDDNTIRAEGLLTRAEMATVINNAFGAVIKADISAYKDVSPDAWYYDEIAKGVNMGTFIGAGDGYMYPDNPITREETFVVIARALVLSDEDTTSLDKFTDKSSVSSWAINAIAALAARGYVNGDEASRVTPNNNITRAEFATLMDNIVKKYYSAEGTYTGTIDGSVMINVGGVTLSNMVINGDLIIGDGVHTGEIRLENVKINGRIIVRGAQKPGKIYIIRSSVRDGVVVNNVNGTVYFDNYQSEVIFKNMLSNTPAEFKKPSSGGGSSSSSSSSRNKLTVTFVLATDLSGNPTNTKVYKVSKGKTLKEQMGEDFVMPTANITYTQDRDSTNEYSHDVSQTGWFSEGRNEYTTDTKIESDVTLYPGWKDFSAKVKTERFNVQGFNGIDINTYYEPNGRVIDAATDLVFANRGRVIKSLSLAEDKVFERPEIQRFITPDKQIKMTNLDMSFKDIFGSTANFKSLFQTQIDEAMQTVPESMRADVEAKIDEALVQIAEKKVWNLRQNNTIGINMPLRDIFGGADSLRTMLKDATDGALESVPDSMRDQIQDELDNVIEFIVASEPNESLDKDKYTNIEDHLALNEFFGGKDDFADMLKTEAEGVITSNVPTNMQDDVRTALHSVIDDLAGKTVWDINASNATKGISTSITLSELFGGEAAFAQMMKDELDTAIENITDEVLKAQIKNKVGNVIDVLANKTEWSLSDDDGKTTINLKKSVPEILGGVDAMKSLIKGEIDSKLTNAPVGIKTQVTTPIYSAVDILVGKSEWQVGDPDGKKDVKIDITLDDVFGGEGEFTNAVKGAINDELNSLPEPYKTSVSSPVLTAVDSILAFEGGWKNNYADGYADVDLRLSVEDLFSNQTGGFDQLINDKIDATLVGMPTSFANEFENKVRPKIDQLINETQWQKNTANYIADLNVKLTPADIYGNGLEDYVSGQIDTKVEQFKNYADFDSSDIRSKTLGLLNSETWDYNNDDYKIPATSKINVSQAFGGAEGFATEIKNAIATDISGLSSDNQTAINDAIDSIAAAPTWSKNGAEGNVSLNFEVPLKDVIGYDKLDELEIYAAGNQDNLDVVNAIRNGIEFSVTNDNKTFVQNLLTAIKNSTVNVTAITEINNAIQKGFVSETEVAATINSAKSDYEIALQSAIDNAPIGDPVKTVISVSESINISERFLTEMQTQLGSVTYADISGSITDITDVVGSVETEFNTAKDNFISKINEALSGTEIDSKFELSIVLNLNKIFLEQMQTVINSKTYADVIAIYPSLGNYVDESLFNSSMDTYKNSIAAALGESHTSMSSALSIAKSVDVAELMMKELKKVVDDLTYGQLGISEDITNIVGNGIEDQFNTVKSDYSNRITDALDNGVALLNEVEFALNINVNELFLNGMKDEISAIDYDADVKPKLDNLLGTDLIEMVGASNIKTAFNSAKDSYLQDIQSAIDSSDNSVGDTISIEINVDVTKLLLEGLSAKIGNYDYDKLKNDGYIQQELIDVVGEETLKTAVNGAISAYKTEVDEARADSSKTLTNEISINVDVNVNKIILEQMETKISAISFDEVKGYDAIDKILDSGLIDEATLKGAFEAARDAYADKVSAVVGTSATLDNNVALEVEINMVDLIIKALGDWLTGKTYDDVKDKINVDSSIEEALGDKLEEEVNKALDEYRKRIENINDGTSTKFDTSYTLTIDINITELVINGLIGKLEPLTYDDIKDDLGQDMVDLLGEEYLREQFVIAKTNMIDGIEEAIDPESDKGLTGDIFRLKLGLDVYSLLLQQIDKQIGNMSYDLVSDKIPEQIKKVLGEEIIETQYNKVINDFGARVDEAVAAIERGDTEVILDCTLRISINLIDEILKPLYERYLAEAEDKLGEYYTENEYLVAIKEILTPDNLLDIDGVATDELSGYKLRDYDDYYDILEKVVLLSDKAIIQFSEDVPYEKKEELVSTYIDLSYDYYDRIVELARTALTYIDNVNVDIDSILPSKEAMEEKKQGIKDNAILIVKNPDMTAKEAFEKAFEYISVIDGRDGVEISENATWDNFVITINKAKETITVKNRTSIPEME